MSETNKEGKDLQAQIDLITNRMEEQDALIANRDESITKLEAKNSELLGKIQKGKEASAEAQSVAQKEVEEKLREEGNWEALLTAERTKFTTKEEELALAKDKHRSAQRELDSIRTDSALTVALDAAGVNRGRAIIERDMRSLSSVKDGVPVIAGLTVADYVKNWAQTDEAQDFISSQNSGGGTQQSSGTSTKSFKDMTFDERTEYFENGGQKKPLFG